MPAADPLAPDPLVAAPRRLLDHPAVRRRLRRARELLGDDPRWLPVVLRATPMGTAKGIGPTTELVIEGFPRSGNTFAVFALARAQGRPLSISSHVHVPAQVRRAVELRLPTLVVVRSPLDALTSLLVAAPHVDPRRVWSEWLHHHRELLPLQRSRDGFEVATFSQVTTDLGSVTRRINDRFGTGFVPFADHDPQATADVFAAIDAHHLRVHGRTPHVLPRPVPGRREGAATPREALRKAVPERVQLAADELYRAFVALAGPSGDTPG